MSICRKDTITPSWASRASHGMYASELWPCLRREWNRCRSTQMPVVPSRRAWTALLIRMSTKDQELGPGPQPIHVTTGLWHKEPFERAKHPPQSGRNQRRNIRNPMCGCISSVCRPYGRNYSSRPDRPELHRGIEDQDRTDRKAVRDSSGQCWRSRAAQLIDIKVACRTGRSIGPNGSHGACWC